MLGEKERERRQDNLRDTLAFCEHNFVRVYTLDPEGQLPRGEVVGLLKRLRDARQDFMSAVDEGGGRMNANERALLADAENLSIIVAGQLNVTDEEINAAEPVFKVSPPKVSDTLNWPPRFDKF